MEVVARSSSSEEDILMAGIIQKQNQSKLAHRINQHSKPNIFMKADLSSGKKISRVEPIVPFIIL